MNLKTFTVISSYVYFLCLCISHMNAYGTSEIKKGYQNLNELRHSDDHQDISSLREPHHRHKRGFRSSVAERIAHGFGKRTISVYTGVNRLADLLSTGYREDEVPQTKIGIPVLQLAKQFHDDQNTLVDYLSGFIDRDGDGFLESDELFGEQYVPNL